MSKMPWIFFMILGSVMAKKIEPGEEPDYYPRINPNPYNIEDLSVQDIPNYFDTFNRFYEMDYKNDEHLNRTYEKFTNNVKRIIIMNKFSTAARFAINEFSHLTLEEFTNKFTGFNDTEMNSGDVSPFTYNSTADAPKNLDWRTLGIPSSVRHQGPCKSSYVFSTVAQIESQMAKQFKMNIRLSEQQAYDCESTGSCKYGGMPHKVMEAIIEMGGIAEQINYVYDPKDQRECKTKEDLMAVKVTTVQRIMPEYENSLIALLAMYGPIVTTIYVSESVKNYHKGVLWPTDCDKKPNHAVLLVGYGITADSIPFWIIQNSWGTLWGESGYIRLIRGERACNIGQYVATATVEPIFKAKADVRARDQPPLSGFLNNVAGAIFSLITTSRIKSATKKSPYDYPTKETIKLVTTNSTSPKPYYDEVDSVESNTEVTAPSINKNQKKVKKFKKVKNIDNNNSASKRDDEVDKDNDGKLVARIEPKHSSSSSESSSSLEDPVKSNKTIRVLVNTSSKPSSATQKKKKKNSDEEDSSDSKSFDSDDIANTEITERVTKV